MNINPILGVRNELGDVIANTFILCQWAVFLRLHVKIWFLEHNKVILVELPFPNGNTNEYGENYQFKFLVNKSIGP